MDFKRIILFAVFIFTSLDAFSAVKKEKIRPADVYALVKQLQVEIDLLRRYMGKPKNTLPEISVFEAEPREVYFQAYALYTRAERFCFEQTSRRAVTVGLKRKNVVPADVYQLVEKTLERIKKVKGQFRITKKVLKHTIDSRKKPTDVYRAIVQAQRQLNFMVDIKIAPEDVYQQVVRAINLTESTLGKFNKKINLSEPSLEKNKFPNDVNKVLIQNFKILRKLIVDLGYPILKIESVEGQRVSPSDVYITASLIVSESEYLHEQVSAKKKVKPSLYPGRKFPSDVYQKAQYLKIILLKLEELKNLNPNILKAVKLKGQ